MRRVFAIMRRYRVATACLAVLVVAVSVKGWKRITEPRYGDKGVREWIEQLPYDSGSRSEANVALDHFGLAAMPYLLETLGRPYAWEERLALKLPGVFAKVLPPQHHLMNMRYAALYKLGQMGAAERERNEWRDGAEYPVADRVLPILGRQLDTSWRKADGVLHAIESFGPRATNITPSLKNLWRTGLPGGAAWMWHPYVNATRLLGRLRDRTLAPEFVELMNPTNHLQIRAAAAEALGLTGHVDDNVAAALTAGLEDADTELQNSCLLACARLGICPPRALELMEDPIRVNAWAYLRVLAPVLRWRCDTNNAAAIQTVIDRVKTDALHWRVALVEFLGSTGPAARPFVATLVPMLDEPALRTPAGRALRAIDPQIAEKETRARFRLREPERP